MRAIRLAASRRQLIVTRWPLIRSSSSSHVSSSISHRHHSTLTAEAATSFIHPTAILAPGAVIGDGVHIGPYCVVGEHVALGDGVRLDSHVRVAGHTAVGAGTVVNAFATLGATPQDLKYAGEASRLEVGERCRIAEYAHLSGGTAAGGHLTSIADDCFIMSHCHVAHDCILGRGVLLATASALAGHVSVGDGARISGYACVHQKVAIGRGAFVGGAAVLAHDLIPHGLAIGNRAQLHSLNLIGLRRRQVAPMELRALLSAFRYLFGLGRDGGRYQPTPLPYAPTLRERAQALLTASASQQQQQQEEAAVPDAIRQREQPTVAEMAQFVLGRRGVGDSSSGSGDAANRPLCLPEQSRRLDVAPARS